MAGAKHAHERRILRQSDISFHKGDGYLSFSKSMLSHHLQVMENNGASIFHRKRQLNVCRVGGEMIPDG